MGTKRIVALVWVLFVVSTVWLGAGAGLTSASVLNEGRWVGNVQVWAGVRTPNGDVPEPGVCFESGSARACTDASGWGEFVFFAGTSGTKTYDVGLVRPPGVGSGYICRLQPFKNGWWEEVYEFGLWDPVHAKVDVNGGTGAKLVCVRLPVPPPPPTPKYNVVSPPLSLDQAVTVPAELEQQEIPEDTEE